MTPRIWLIGGPTASGKSGLALRLAQSLEADGGAEIIGADSMQIYAGLPVLTAAPTAQDQALVPHHLIGVADAAQAWSVGRWLEAAEALLAAIDARGRHAIVTGGTGLYFNALIRGLTPTPQISAAQRDESAARLAEQGEAVFRDELATLDPAAAQRIEIGDRQRLIRAHAVAVCTGRSLSDWQAETRPLLAPGSYRAIALLPPREVLYPRCDQRLLTMIDDGALDEVRAMEARGIPADLPALKAVGYRELAAFLAGQATLEDSLAQAQMQTRRYAKRQGTWFRNQATDWQVIDAPDPDAQWRALGVEP